MTTGPPRSSRPPTSDTGPAPVRTGVSGRALAPSLARDDRRPGPLDLGMMGLGHVPKPRVSANGATGYCRSTRSWLAHGRRTDPDAFAHASAELLPRVAHEPDAVARARGGVQAVLKPALEWAQDGPADGWLRHRAVQARRQGRRPVRALRAGRRDRAAGRAARPQASCASCSRGAPRGPCHGRRQPALAIELSGLDFSQQLAMGSS